MGWLVICLVGFMNVTEWFFGSWSVLLKTVIVGLSCYVSLIFLLRVSGKRTLSKMNMFDFIVTVALGSIMASTLVSKEVTYLQGVVAFATLIGAQYLVTLLSTRSRAFHEFIQASPTILYYQGQFDEQALKKQRVPQSEVLAAIRQGGYSNAKDVAAVVLESNGHLTVLSSIQKPVTTLAMADNWTSIQTN